MKKIKGFLLLIGLTVMMLTSCGKTSDDEQNQSEQIEEGKSVKITAQEAKEIMDQEEGFIILDVREADEFSQGHIEGAMQISYTELADKAEAALPDKNQKILVYCRSGHRSGIAAQTLVQMGYTDIEDFGGIIDWPYEVVK